MILDIVLGLLIATAVIVTVVAVMRYLARRYDDRPWNTF